MKILSFVLKRLLYPSCAFFTIIWFVVCVAIDAFYDIVNINVSTALMCYFIAFFMALSNNILTVDRIPWVGRVGLHLVFSVTSVSIVVAVFSAVSGTYAITSRSFYLVLILVIVYILFAIPSVVIYERLRKKRKSNSSGKSVKYDSMFK